MQIDSITFESTKSHIHLIAGRSVSSHDTMKPFFSSFAHGDANHVIDLNSSNEKGRSIEFHVHFAHNNFPIDSDGVRRQIGIEFK